MQFGIRKLNRRLRIVVVETGESVYTPPDFVRSAMRSRNDLSDLMAAANTKGHLDIRDITEFETAMRPV